MALTTPKYVMMARSSLSDEALLSATARDVEAFGHFYRRHASSVLAYLAYRTHSAELALDLTAEVFAAALEGSHRYRPSRGPARAWLFGIAHHVLVDSNRRQRSVTRARKRLGLEPLVFTDPEIERVEELVDVGRRDPPLTALVGDLPEDQRAAVLARVVDEREYRDIAAQEGVSEGAVRQRVSRGLARLAHQTRGDDHA